jgi:hypothetical protein
VIVKNVAPEVVSLEALQKAALQRGDSRTAEWLNSSGLGKQPRLAAQLSVNGGWERAVETALGDYLEALCVDELDAVADVLPSLPVGRISLLQAGGTWKPTATAACCRAWSAARGHRAAAVARAPRRNAFDALADAPRACRR